MSRRKVLMFSGIAFPLPADVGASIAYIETPFKAGGQLCGGDCRREIYAGRGLTFTRIFV